jgi:hypothetical protein
MANYEDKKAEQKLWEAASRGDSATIRALAMTTDIDINARNEDGFTAYSLATQKGYHNTALTILAARHMRYMSNLEINNGAGHRAINTKVRA